MLHRKKEKTQLNNVIFFKSIKVKMIGGFLISVLFIIALGIISYQKASEGLMQKYEQSTHSALNMTQKYFEVVLKGISSKASQINSSSVITSYYGGKYKKDPVTEYKSIDEIRTTLTSFVSSDQYLQDISLVANYGQALSSSGLIQGTFYKGFSESTEGKNLLNSKDGEVWAGKHSYLDEQLKIDSSKYSLTYISYLKSSVHKNIGFIIMDLKQEMIETALKDMNLDKGSIVGFITADHNEVIIGDSSNKFSFTAQKFYNSPLNKTTDTDTFTDGISTIQYQNQEYRFFYSRNNDVGVTICAMIPAAVILRQAVDLRNITFIFVAFACIIAGLIGTKLATGISGTIKKSNKYLKKVSEGDLTSTFSIKRSDEFQLLTKGITDTIFSMKTLIGKMKTVSSKVTETSENIVHSTSVLLHTTQGITSSVDDIRQGVAGQAQDAESCLLKMESLSNQINLMQQNTSQIKQSTLETKTSVNQSIEVIDTLSKKAQATNDITQTIIHDIEGLEEQSNQISDFVAMINDISEQTNLLSLNASIEAARAGAMGKGFAIVADEIRKLADQSSNASSKIAEIISAIQQQTKKSVSTAKEAEIIVESQKQALNSTIFAFRQIDTQVTDLSENLMVIISGIEEIENAKNDTLEAIESISAISEETAAATEVLSSTTDNQLSAVEVLNQAAKLLQEDAGDLNDAIKVFKL